MPLVLAGAVFTPAEIAMILTALALLGIAALLVLLGEIVQPFTLRRATPGWTLGFIPLVGPHLAVHHWRMGDRWHAALAGTAGGAVVLGLGAGLIRDDVAELLAGGLSVGLLLAHFAVRLHVAWRQAGRDTAALGWRWLLMPVAWAILPATYVRIIRAGAGPAAGPPPPPA